jgi:HD-GYP domain-containing protein (c-di-GMP phosphodiesterase class II)/tRNA A-37 threonylcarbamoyl transferase component Bud32
MTLSPLRMGYTSPGSLATPIPGQLSSAVTVALAVPGLPTVARSLLNELLQIRLLDLPTVREFLARHANRLATLTTADRVGAALTHAGLLTPYQQGRVISGRTFGLVLGSYRVLDRIGGGTDGVEFLGEHVLLRRRVAMKVLPVDDTVPADLIERFQAETRVLASLDHPHVVTAFDAGVLHSPGGGEPALHYLVLELVPGGDLEQLVYANGPQPVARACEWGRQAAAGLQAAHDRHLVHRDLKPSNLLLTADQQVKVVDFGLARQLTSSLTRPGRLVGSIDFMSPEQSLDPTAVGPAADVYGLGATLFWVITGHLPIARGQTAAETVRSLSTAKVRSIREFRDDIPAELDTLLARMLARDPSARPSAVEVMHGLTPFTLEDAPDVVTPGSGSEAIRLRETVRQLGGTLRSRDDAVRKAQGAVLFAMAKMGESHDGETEGHLRRLQQYVRLLAERLKSHRDWGILADRGFVEELVRCVPLHDIGKIAIPDAVLNKPGMLEPNEWKLVHSHPVVGAAMLEALAREHGDSLTFLGLARVVVRHHHERWDGEGYPDRLAGQEIPHAARLVAVADVYDSLRRDRPHRPGLPHADATAAVLASRGQFDPAVLGAFEAIEKQFEEVWATNPN